MEQSKEQFFDVIAGDKLVFPSVLQQFNEQYQSDFQIVEFEERDHVLFAVVKFSKASLSDLFLLGFYFGMRVQNKRNSKEINW